MKYQTSLLLGVVGATSVLAQECPAGYSPSVSYVTVTMTPTAAATSSVASDECPAGSSLTTSYITVTASEAEPVATSLASASSEESAPTSAAATSSAESVATSAAAATSSGEQTTTIWTTGTVTSTITVHSAGATASPVNAVEDNVSAASAAPAASSATSAASPVASTSAASSSLGSSVSGLATFYGGNVAGGTCSFSTYTLPSGLYGTALSNANWDAAANCGACVSVTGPNGNSITAMIVDKCPECAENQLDLFSDAFAALSDPSAGKIDISWEYVSCPISSPLEVVNKDGTSPYWFSMQVVNAADPTESLEVSTDGGSTWQSTTRQDYNFFENSSGFGTDTVDVKITSSTGKSVTIDDVSVSSGVSATASSNI